VAVPTAHVVPDAPAASITSRQRRRRSRGGAHASQSQRSATSHLTASPPTAPAKRFVFLDIAKQDFLKDPFVGRIVIELFSLGSPKTVKNFTTLCHNKKYINTQFHRVIQGFMVQGGDIVNQDGSGVYSIYGGEGTTFEDESFALKHSEPGIVSMANSGPNTNGSQFFITTHATPHLDGKHCAFGKVVRGMEFIYDVEKELTDGNNRPIRRCYIMNSGLLTTKRKRSHSGGTAAEYEFEAVGTTTQSNGRATFVAEGV
jgi:cyclophilin family peptidyl-prolyl cis-trans isomerase